MYCAFQQENKILKCNFTRLAMTWQSRAEGTGDGQGIFNRPSCYCTGSSQGLMYIRHSDNARTLTTCSIKYQQRSFWRLRSHYSCTHIKSQAHTQLTIVCDMPWLKCSRIPNICSLDSGTSIHDLTHAKHIIHHPPPVRRKKNNW